LGLRVGFGLVFGSLLHRAPAQRGELGQQRRDRACAVAGQLAVTRDVQRVQRLARVVVRGEAEAEAEAEAEGRARLRVGVGPEQELGSG
jgi:hypothetical protein